MNIYDIGDVVRCTGSFKDNTGAAIDPPTVKFKKKDPAGTITTLTYGVDSAVVKDSVGNYRCDVDCDRAGIFYYRWESTGGGKGAQEASFEVAASQF